MTEHQGRILDTLRRECSRLDISLEESSRGWNLTGSKNGERLIETQGKQLGHVRSEFLSAYAKLIQGGLLAA